MTNTYHPYTVLAAAVHLHATEGFVSKKEAEATGNPPSSHRLAQLFESGFVPSEDDHLKAREIIRHISDQQAKRYDNFRESQLDVLSRQKIKPTQFGFVACAPASYERDMARAIEDAERAANSPSDYLGEVGKFLNVEVTVVRVHEGEGNYGPYTAYTFADKHGNELSAFYTGSTFEADKGETLVLRGKVKRHEPFRGIKQTALSHIKRAA